MSRVEVKKSLAEDTGQQEFDLSVDLTELDEDVIDEVEQAFQKAHGSLAPLLMKRLKIKLPQRSES